MPWAAETVADLGRSRGMEWRIQPAHNPVSNMVQVAVLAIRDGADNVHGASFMTSPALALVDAANRALP